MKRVAVAGLAAALGWNCGLTGPSCLERRESGPVATISGDVAAGAIASHEVRYDTRGSQNDARISWSGQGDGTRIRVYATRVGCTDFRTDDVGSSGDCAVLASAGAFDGGIATTLIVTHGRGNPEVLGSAPAYKLWVVGDSERNASYTIAITWFFGPDC